MPHDLVSPYSMLKYCTSIMFIVLHELLISLYDILVYLIWFANLAVNISAVRYESE